MPSKIKQFKAELNEQVSKEIMAIRVPHTKATSDTAMLIAEKIGTINRYDLHTACVLHDIAKELSYETMVKIIINARGNPLLDDVIGDIDISEYSSQKWLHGIVGAIVAHDIYNVTSKDVLKAIRYHKIGNLHDPIFTKILIAADVANPLRRARHMVSAYTALKMQRYDIEEVYPDIVRYDAGVAISMEDVVIPRMIEGLTFATNKLNKCPLLSRLGKFYLEDAECVWVSVPDYEGEGNAWKKFVADGVYITPDGFQNAMTVLDNITHPKNQYNMLVLSQKDSNSFMVATIQIVDGKAHNEYEIIPFNESMEAKVYLPRGYFPKQPTRYYTIDMGEFAAI